MDSKSAQNCVDHSHRLPDGAYLEDGVVDSAQLPSPEVERFPDIGHEPWSIDPASFQFHYSPVAVAINLVEVIPITSRLLMQHIISLQDRLFMAYPECHAPNPMSFVPENTGLYIGQLVNVFPAVFHSVFSGVLPIYNFDANGTCSFGPAIGGDGWFWLAGCNQYEPAYSQPRPPLPSWHELQLQNNEPCQAGGMS